MELKPFVNSLSFAIVKEVRKLAGQTLIYGFGTIVRGSFNYAILTFSIPEFLQNPNMELLQELYAWMVLLLVVLTYGMETGFFRFHKKKRRL